MGLWCGCGLYGDLASDCLSYNNQSNPFYVNLNTNSLLRLEWNDNTEGDRPFNLLFFADGCLCAIL